mgnify:CR=1 FL=1
MMDGVSQTIRMLEQRPVITGQFNQFVESTHMHVVTHTHQEKTEQDLLCDLAKHKHNVDEFKHLVFLAT